MNTLCETKFASYYVGDNYYTAPPPAPEYGEGSYGGYAPPPPAPAPAEEGGTTTIINEDGGLFGHDEQTIIHQSEFNTKYLIPFLFAYMNAY